MKIRIRAGDSLLIIIRTPQLSSSQKLLLLGILFSVIINLFMIFSLKFIIKDEVAPIKPLSNDEKMVILNLMEDKEIEKARELLENPKANEIKPDDAKILSDRDSKNDLMDIPDHLKNSKSVAVVENKESAAKDDIGEDTKTEKTDEDRFQNNQVVQPVFPFLKKSDGKSVREQITGEAEVPSQGFLYELSSYKWEFAPYMLKWKNKMVNKWYDITSKIFFSPFAKLGSMRIYVKMNRQGQLLESHVVDYDCDKSFVTPAYASVVNSFPLDPLPPAFPEDMLETTWTITITN
ncbi:hypothetical protein JNM05_03885 [bacterium]|nr:hypothetical protein [bacterium]